MSSYDSCEKCGYGRNAVKAGICECPLSKTEILEPKCLEQEHFYE